MARVAYVSGHYVPLSEAAVSVEDRGFQFADGIYEVFGLRNGLLLDYEGHMARLHRSLSAIGMSLPMSEAALGTILRETIRRNGLRSALVYLQITRGAAPRDHAFPKPARTPSVIVTVRPISWNAIEQRAKTGIRVITMPDLRWKRCDIKSIALLPNVLAKQEARGNGAQEAWLFDEAGLVTEGSSSNAWIVTQDGVLVTRPLNVDILAGVTRDTILAQAARQGVSAQLRAFSVDEALHAREAFISSATNLVMPVIAIDGSPIGEGTPGPLTRALRKDYFTT